MHIMCVSVSGHTAVHLSPKPCLSMTLLVGSSDP